MAVASGLETAERPKVVVDATKSPGITSASLQWFPAQGHDHASIRSQTRDALVQLPAVAGTDQRVRACEPAREHPSLRSQLASLTCEATEMLRKLAKQDRETHFVVKTNDGLKKELLSEVQWSARSRNGQTTSSEQLPEMEMVLREYARLSAEMKTSMCEVEKVLQLSAGQCKAEAPMEGDCLKQKSAALCQEQDATQQGKGVPSSTLGKEGTAWLLAATGEAGACTHQPDCGVKPGPQDPHVQDQLDRWKCEMEVMAQKLRRQDEEGKLVAKENHRLKQELTAQLLAQRSAVNVNSFPALEVAGSCWRLGSLQTRMSRL